ncbi:YlxR family protein [Mycoplasma sp. Mirounga ES2805-ORL]|uniref:YlxR family protein n=1 Tax=Mycoplasma sp. Mirounga ES2805-ORL TaxID=754514 RepID=UPI00197BABE6|nr:YlxR family protein [Mycoplasma sp. Mirounga ES2805-ORL]QSF13566.1 YlxR family protein [Mycoplasma sp. Mirounga ES2805-ORL]
MKIEINKIFKRKCIITNQIIEANKLIRFDYDKKNNIITLDIQKNKKGRGAYFLPSEENWQKIVKTRGLNRAFRTKVSNETYKSIEQQLEEHACLKKIQE